MSSEDLTELLAEARAGDLTALDQLLSALRPELIRLTTALVGPRLAERIEADDLFQEAAIHAFASIKGLRAENLAGFRSWFRSIVRHRIFAVAHAARPRIRPRTTTPLPSDAVTYFAPEAMPEGDGPSTADLHEQVQALECTREELFDLVTDHRMSLVLHDVYGTGIMTMAFLLGRPNGTSVRATRRRAMTKLSPERRA